MIAQVLFLLLIPLLMGFILVSILWPDQRPFASHLTIKLFFAAGIGLGLFSCFFFIWLLVFGPSGSGIIATSAALVVLMAAILVYRIRKLRRPPSSETTDEPRPALKSSRLLAALFIVALVFSLVSFISLMLKKPHGDWDAWAIWNVRARFLFRGGDQWTNAFSNLMEFGRPDYPLLVPATTAGLWTSLGDDTALVPMMLSLLFTFAAVGLTVSSLSVLRGKSQAFLAGIVLLGTPLLITQGTAQYADVPIAFFFLATFVLLALQDNQPEDNHRFLILAGLTAGLAAWTKNEGIIFAAAVAVARLIAIVPVKGFKFYVKQMLAFAAGLAPILAIVFYFKLTLAPTNYLTDQNFQTTFQKLLDTSRHLTVWDTFAKTVTGFGEWAISIPLLLALYFLLVGVRTGREKLSTIASAVTLGLMLVGYSLTYVITPYNMVWQLGASLNRIFLGLWPSFLFVYFMAVRPFDQVSTEELILHPDGDDAEAAPGPQTVHAPEHGH